MSPERKDIGDHSVILTPCTDSDDWIVAVIRYGCENTAAFDVIELDSFKYSIAKAVYDRHVAAYVKKLS